MLPLDIHLLQLTRSTCTRARAVLLCLRSVAMLPRSLELISAQCLLLQSSITGLSQSHMSFQRFIRTRVPPAHRPAALGGAAAAATTTPPLTTTAAVAETVLGSTHVPQPSSARPAKPLDLLQPYIPEGTPLPKVPASSYSVRSAEFVSAAYEWAQLPHERWPEIAVVGRSNVGKSSLINYLLGNTSLAKVSKHPGKTKSINHYLVNRQWCLVDCPGYGYAKVSQGTRADWHAMTQRYFSSRGALVDVLLLVDASLPPKQMDLAGADWLVKRDLPVTVVFTKTDKSKGAAPQDHIAAFRAALLEAGLRLPPQFATSAAAKQGARQLLQYLAQRRAAAEAAAAAH